MPDPIVLSQQHLALMNIEKGELVKAWRMADEFLRDIPNDFSLTPTEFYTILNQRNLSGFVGETFASAFALASPRFTRNPHPDGRPDLLDMHERRSVQFYERECFDEAGSPIRRQFAPYKFGGIEVKATIGSNFTKKASEMPIGFTRLAYVKGLTYWAHHRHSCRLLGIYFDYFPEFTSSPQICALFMADIAEDDWHGVSVGKDESKKTSNTSLNAQGRAKILGGLAGYRDHSDVIEALRGLGVAGV